MDINGTYFHLLTGENDWERELEKRGVRQLWWDRQKACLNLLPRVLQLGADATASPPQLPVTGLQAKDRRGAAQDSYGNSFWISEDRRGIYIMPATATDSAIYWQLDELNNDAEKTTDADFVPLNSSLQITQTLLQGLTVSTHHYLLAGTLNPAGLLVLDLYGGGSPSWLHWPEQLQFSPFDMSPSADGGICILDSNLASDTARYWQLDRYFRVVHPAADAQQPADNVADFLPLPGAGAAQNGAKIYTHKLSLQPAIPLLTHQAIAIEALADGSVLILASSADESCSTLHHLHQGVQTSVIELRDGILANVFAEPQIKAHDFALLVQAAVADNTVTHQSVKNACQVNGGQAKGGLVKGELSLVLDNGNQAVSFELKVRGTELDLVILPRFIPLRQYTGKALMLGRGGEGGESRLEDRLYYDMNQRWYALTAQPRSRYASEADIAGLVFDGKQNNCVWHRIVIDGCIPDATAIEIETRCAEEEALLQYSEWQTEVSPYLRGDGSEIPLHQAYSKKEWQGDAGQYEAGQNEAGRNNASWRNPGLHNFMGSWEWLLQNARGRFIELRLRFTGNGRATPQLRAMRVYYPRYSYLHKFLPAVYREDVLQASFLDRYLANVEGFFSKLESQVASAQAYFDTRTAPAEYLQWLASWLGATLDESWSETRQRLFIDNAELLFRWRSTRIGLRAMIRLIIDECPDESIFAELKNGRDFTSTGAAGGSVRIVERFMFRQQAGVLTTDSQIPAQQGLLMSTLSTNFQELGNRQTLDRRYAEFIYHRYVQLAVLQVPDLQQSDQQQPAERQTLNALVLLNQVWQAEQTLNSFDEITFSEQRPQHPAQLQDWSQFVHHELALLQAWQPSHGVYALHVRFQEYCRKKYSQISKQANNQASNQATNQTGDATGYLAEIPPNALQTLNQRWQTNFSQFEQLVFSPLTPTQPEIAADWIEFTETSLGFQYAQVSEKDSSLYREFLSRRYKQIGSLNQVYGLSGDKTWQSFSDISLPAENQMPGSPAALNDWIQFVSLMLPVRRNAHKFTVLVPTEPGELPQSRSLRLAQVEKIVRREKPAHTDFDVKLYWALFQVGSARLGLDTNLGQGARYIAIVLGQSYLGQGYVASSVPWNVTDRHIAGRDVLRRPTHGE